MKILNTGLFYFGTDGTAYHGKIKLSQREMDYSIHAFMKDRKIEKTTKEILMRDVERCENDCYPFKYALRVTFTDYLTSLYKNQSRYNYKRQNYIIEIL